MTSRKKNLLLIQFTIFLLAIALLYNTYHDKKKETKTFVEIKAETNPDTNTFTDIEYSGFDLSGIKSYKSLQVQLLMHMTLKQ